MPCFHLKRYEIKWISGFIYNHSTNSAIHYLSIKMHRFIYKKIKWVSIKKQKQPIFWFLEQRLIYCISYTVFCIHSVFRSFFVCFLFFFFVIEEIQVGVCVGGGGVVVVVNDWSYNYKILSSFRMCWFLNNYKKHLLKTNHRISTSLNEEK